jgi:hypothetical protein
MLASLLWAAGCRRGGHQCLLRRDYPVVTAVTKWLLASIADNLMIQPHRCFGDIRGLGYAYLGVSQFERHRKLVSLPFTAIAMAHATLGFIVFVVLWTFALIGRTS